MSTARQIHVVHLLIRRQGASDVEFLVYPHHNWRAATGDPFWVLPTKKAVQEPLSPFIQGTSIEPYVTAVMTADLGVGEDRFYLETELEPVVVSYAVPGRDAPTTYTICPVDVWVAAEAREALTARVAGRWVSCAAGAEGGGGIAISPTAEAVFRALALRDEQIHHGAGDRRRKLLDIVPDEPSAEAIALKWLAGNLGGVRHLPGEVIDQVLERGHRAFNLRVADPYLPYQMQGVGCAWSFFSHHDRQFIHVHSAPTIEIYGVLAGELEVWWKPYHARGTSAWSRRVLKAGDWLEVEALQCHLVHWLTAGKGVVFRAGPGPMAEVGKLGVKGKTPCDDCGCIKPPAVVALAEELKKGGATPIAEADDGDDVAV